MMKNVLKKRGTVISVALAGLLAFPACQPTPDREAIAQKEDINEVVEQYADTSVGGGESNLPESGSIAEKKDEIESQDGMRETKDLSMALGRELGVPEAVSFEVSVPGVGDGTTTVTANEARIILPDTDALGAAVVRRNDFAQEQIKAIGDKFFDGRTPYEQMPDTKEDYFEQLELINKQYNDYLSQGMTEEELAGMKEQMDYVQQMIDISPAEADVVLEPVDYQWQPMSVPGLESIYAQNNEDGMNYVLSAQKEASFFHLSVSRNSVQNQGQKQLSVLESVIMLGQGAESDWEETVNKAFENNLCNYTPDEAASLCIEYLEDFGFDTKGLVISDIKPMVWYDYTNNVLGDGIEGYSVTLSHGVNGVGQTDAANSIAYVPDGGKVTYDYEKLTMTVDNFGVAQLIWSNPMVMGETLAEKVTLLPFDQILERITEHVTLAYENYIMDERLRNGESLDVDRITLGMMRIQNEDSETEYTLIPVWDVFSSQLGTYSLVTINAMDGSIISRENGY